MESYPRERRRSPTRSGQPTHAAPGSDLSPTGLLGWIAQRVRAGREARGESRAQLALRAGLSVRFLAQLEAGDANISVLRLQEVAQALGTALPDLLRPPDTVARSGPERTSGGMVRTQIDALLEHRSHEELAEALDWLAVRFTPSTGPLVALLGLRGAGKTSVGRELARQLGVGFYELDALIEDSAGLSLEQIFELQGQAYYRKLESQELARFLATKSEGVLATGGGIVTEPETFALLRRRCFTVWLRAKPEEHWERVVRQGDRRPMQDNPAAMLELRSLLAAREPLYAQAHLSMETSRCSIADVAEQLANAVSLQR